MKKKTFWICFSIIVVLAIISTCLKKTGAVCYVVSATLLLEVYNEKIFTGSLKAYYKAKNKLEKYHKICIITCIILLIFGTVNLVFN